MMTERSIRICAYSVFIRSRFSATIFPYVLRQTRGGPDFVSSKLDGTPGSFHSVTEVDRALPARTIVPYRQIAIRISDDSRKDASHIPYTNRNKIRTDRRIIVRMQTVRFSVRKMLHVIIVSCLKETHNPFSLSKRDACTSSQSTRLIVPQRRASVMGF